MPYKIDFFLQILSAMSYLQPTPESHPPGYDGMYSAVDLKKGIIEFILKDSEDYGHRLHATKDIIVGLKKLYNIEFDFHSVEYVMRNMMHSEGTKQVGTTTVDSVVKKCEDGKTREFVAAHEQIKPQYPHGLYEPGYFDPRATKAKEIAKSEAHIVTGPSDIPPNLTEYQLYKLYIKLNNVFAFGATYNPGTFTEFKKNSGY